MPVQTPEYPAGLMPVRGGAARSPRRLIRQTGPTSWAAGPLRSGANTETRPQSMPCGSEDRHDCLAGTARRRQSSAPLPPPALRESANQRTWTAVHWLV